MRWENVLMWQSFEIETCTWQIPVQVTQLHILRVGKESSAALEV